MKKIKIGSRKSDLALWQTKAVESMLNQTGLETEIVTMETKGDKILHTAISKIGSKGVFTEEIEALLKQGDIDMAVHSAKDMPSNLPEGFCLIAYTAREKANDVLVGFNKDLSLEDTSKKPVIGTSSVRRVAMLKYYYPHVQTVNIRGNLQTRIKKMKNGQCDGLLLAYAGVKRMKFDHLIVREMPETEFVPPVGQGAMAIEVYQTIDKKLKQKIREAVNHEPTEAVLKAERAFLKQLQGGCSIPAFALGESMGDKIKLTAGLISLDGLVLLKKSLTDQKEAAADMGKRLGKDILENGGEKILDDIKNNG